VSEKSRRRSALQRAMRKILPEEKHITVILDLTGPWGDSPPHYDRMAAIVSAAFLEYGLKKAIKTHLKPDKDDPDYNYLLSQDDAPYRDFAALNRLARALGIIDATEYDHLETIRHIRNVFAHGMDHSLTFDSPEISEVLDSLMKPGEEWFDSLVSVFLNKEATLKVLGRRRTFIQSVFWFYWRLILYDPRGYAGALAKFLA
jgi:hypothetical protein